MLLHLSFHAAADSHSAAVSLLNPIGDLLILQHRFTFAGIDQRLKAHIGDEARNDDEHDGYTHARHCIDLKSYPPPANIRLSFDTHTKFLPLL